MHCSSFSKSLAPGYRVGWVAGGRYAEQIERLKLMTSPSASIPAQAAIADYSPARRLRPPPAQLRYALETQQNAMLAAVARYFPEQTWVSRPSGGYFLWLELPGGGRLVACPTWPWPRASASPRGRSFRHPPLRPLRPAQLRAPVERAAGEGDETLAGGIAQSRRDDAPQTESHPGVGG